MKSYFFIVAAFLTFVMCGNGKRTITGQAGPLESSQIYLYDVSGMSKQSRAADSARIENGRFEFDISNLSNGLVFIGTAFTPDKGGYVLIDGDDISISAKLNEKGDLEWDVEGSPSDKIYREFQKRYYVATEQHVRDSLSDLFQRARVIGDREEMARLKEQSMPYYERGNENGMKLVEQMVAENRENPAGAYLYASYVFPRRHLATTEDVATERKYMDGFGVRAKETSSFNYILKQIDKYEGCAIGSPAPEVAGVDTLGNPLKLSDLRGNYVIVDFWDSYCHWCRQETPHLLKALKEFKGKNFRILGVSMDRDKQRWIDAIREDGSNWDHLILPEGSDVSDSYCIKGIPHLILVGPDGVILAKDMRWEDHITVTKRFMDGDK